MLNAPFHIQFPGFLLTTRNETGHILDISGPLPQMLESLSKIYEFRYALFQHNK